MTNLKNSIKSCVQIGSLQEIMDNFEIEMTNGQLKTLDLLKEIIKEVSQQNENILEETLLKYAIIGDENENMVFKILRKCIDSEGKIAKIDFENCLSQIIENIKIVESQEIDLTKKQNGEPIFAENEQNIIG